MTKRELHTKHVAAYMTETDFSTLEKLALEENMSLSSFVRFVIRDYMRRKLSEK